MGRQSRAYVLPLAALAMTLLLTLILVFGNSHRDVTTSAETDRRQALMSRDIRFEDQADGGIRVVDARVGQAIALVEPASNGFLRGAVRGLVRERKLRGEGMDIPFTLAVLGDGRLLLHDRATGHEIDLASFGSTNAAVFSKLLHTGGKS